MSISLSAEEKKAIVDEHQRGAGDTGSAEVQIALLTTRIVHLTEHFKKHIHDFHSRKGLHELVSKRRKLLRYLKRTSHDRYHQLIAKLGLRDTAKGK